MGDSKIIAQARELSAEELASAAPGAPAQEAAPVRLNETTIRRMIEAIPPEASGQEADVQLQPVWDAIAALGSGLAAQSLMNCIIDRTGMGRQTARGALADARRRLRAVASEEGREPSDIEILIGLTDGCLLFHTPGTDGECFADVETATGGRLSFPVGSRAFETWLRHGFFDETGRGPTKESMAVAIATIEARARFKGPAHAVFVRVGWIDPGTDAARCFVDLGTDDGAAIEIDASGWRITSVPAVRFRRSSGMLPLPHPEPGGHLEELFQTLNVRSEERPLVLAWLVMCFHHRGAYPVLVLRGEQGSAKSTTAGFLKRLIDPGKASLRAEPKDTEVLMIAATNSWLLAYDNLSKISNVISDAFCRLATPGTGGMATRALYTNGDEHLFEATRPILINGIDDGLIGRSDLADRAVLAECPTIPEAGRRTGEEIEAAFQAMHPRILGALCDAVATAIRNTPHVTLDRRTRMADFEVWGTAAEPAFGCESGTFLAAYRGNRQEANETILAGSPLAQAVLSLLQKGGGRWEGTATAMLAELSDWSGLPRTPKTLYDSIKRLTPNLRAQGIDVSRIKRHGDRLIRFERIRKGAGPSAPSAPDSDNPDGPGLFVGADAPRQVPPSASGGTSPGREGTWGREGTGHVPPAKPADGSGFAPPGAHGALEAPPSLGAEMEEGSL